MLFCSYGLRSHAILLLGSYGLRTEVVLFCYFVVSVRRCASSLIMLFATLVNLRRRAILLFMLFCYFS